MPTNTENPLGFEAARRAVELGRHAFFASATEDIPNSASPQIAADDLLPQFGYVGTRYIESRVLLLGINPGNGPKPRRERSQGDQIAIPALQEFVEKRTPETFLAAQCAYRRVCQGWAIWGRQCDELLRAGGLEMEDVAFTNALPWRTASQSAFSPAIARRAGLNYAGPVVRELKPRLIVAVGKKAATILAYAGMLSDAVVVWNRAQAMQPSVIAERKAAAEKFARLLRTK